MKMRHAHLLICGSLLASLNAFGTVQNSSADPSHDLSMSSSEAADFVATFGAGILGDLEKGIGMGHDIHFSSNEGIDVSDIIRLINPEEKQLTGLGCKPTMTGSDMDADADGVKDNLEKSFDCDLMIAGYGVKANGKAMSLDKDTEDPLGGFTMSVDPFAFKVAFPKDGVKMGYHGNFAATHDVTRTDARYEGKNHLNVGVNQAINEQDVIGGAFSRTMSTVWDNVQNGDLSGATLTSVEGQMNVSVATRPTGPIDYSLVIAGANLSKGDCKAGFKTGDISFTDGKGNVLKASFAEDCKGDWTFNGRKLPVPYKAD